jgi:hypothetical protein
VAPRVCEDNSAALSAILKQKRDCKQYTDYCNKAAIKKICCKSCSFQTNHETLMEKFSHLERGIGIFTKKPTVSPTPAPTTVPTPYPSAQPTHRIPTNPPTASPTKKPTLGAKYQHVVELHACHDGFKNYKETSLDCGGPLCAPCAVGKSCLKAADCTTKFCRLYYGEYHFCAPVTVTLAPTALPTMKDETMCRKMVKEECGDSVSLKTCERCGRENQERFSNLGCYESDVTQACILFDLNNTDTPTTSPTPCPSLQPTKATPQPTAKPTYEPRGTAGVWDDDMAIETPDNTTTRRNNGCLLIYEQMCGPGLGPQQCLHCAKKHKPELFDAKCYQSDVFEICHAGIHDEFKGVPQRGSFACDMLVKDLCRNTKGAKCKACVEQHWEKFMTTCSTDTGKAGEKQVRILTNKFCDANYLLSSTDHRVRFSHLHVREFVQVENTETGIMEEASVLSKSKKDHEETVDLIFDDGRRQENVPYGLLKFKDESTHTLLEEIDRKWVHVVACERMLAIRCPGLFGKICMSCAKFEQNIQHLLNGGCLRTSNIKLACFRTSQTSNRTIPGSHAKSVLQARLERFHYPVNFETTALLRHVNVSNPRLNLIAALKQADVGLTDWTKRLGEKCHSKLPKHYVTEVHFAMPFLQCAEIVYKAGHRSELKKCRSAIDDRFGGKSGPGCLNAVFTPALKSIIGRFVLNYHPSNSFRLPKILC